MAGEGGKWISIYWLIISRRRRDERGEGRTDQHAEMEGAGRWSEPECNLSANITGTEAQGEMGDR